MKVYGCKSYSNIIEMIDLDNALVLSDHLGGFDMNLHNDVLYSLNNWCLEQDTKLNIDCQQIMEDSVLHQYNRLTIRFGMALQYNIIMKHFEMYTVHPRIEFDNFLCSFNGSAHVSRQLLSSIINKFGYFNPAYCSKNFAYSNDFISEHLQYLDLTSNEIQLYRKFFIDNSEFNDTIYSFGHVRYDHAQNIYNLEEHIVLAEYIKMLKRK